MVCKCVLLLLNYFLLLPPSSFQQGRTVAGGTEHAAALAGLVDGRLVVRRRLDVLLAVGLEQ